MTKENIQSTKHPTRTKLEPSGAQGGLYLNVNSVDEPVKKISNDTYYLISCTDNCACIRIEYSSKDKADKRPKYIKILDTYEIYEALWCKPSVNPRSIYEPGLEISSKSDIYIAVWKKLESNNQIPNNKTSLT